MLGSSLYSARKVPTSDTQPTLVVLTAHNQTATVHMKEDYDLEQRHENTILTRTILIPLIETYSSNKHVNTTALDTLK
jgi:hypothetical protein